MVGVQGFGTQWARALASHLEILVHHLFVSWCSPSLLRPVPRSSYRFVAQPCTARVQPSRDTAGTHTASQNLGALWMASPSPLRKPWRGSHGAPVPPSVPGRHCMPPQRRKMPPAHPANSDAPAPLRDPWASRKDAAGLCFCIGPTHATRQLTGAASACKWKRSRAHRKVQRGGAPALPSHSTPCAHVVTPREFTGFYLEWHTVRGSSSCTTTATTSALRSVAVERWERL